LHYNFSNFILFYSVISLDVYIDVKFIIGLRVYSLYFMVQIVDIVDTPQLASARLCCGWRFSNLIDILKNIIRHHRLLSILLLIREIPPQRLTILFHTTYRRLDSLLKILLLRFHLRQRSCTLFLEDIPRVVCGIFSAYSVVLFVQDHL